MYGSRASYGYGRFGRVCAADMVRERVYVCVWEGRKEEKDVAFVRGVLFIYLELE